MKGFDCGKFITALCLAGLTVWGTASAQENSIITRHKVEKFSVKERLAFRTNMVDWVLTTPNIGIQYDVTPWNYNKWTLGANVKWNPGTHQTFTPQTDYSITDVRLEARRYFRQTKVRKRMPKRRKAYYWGMYAGYTDYTVFLKNGYTGKHLSLGGTAGWEMQLYRMKNGALDLDLGVNAGWMYGKYKKRADNVNGGFVFTEEKDWHITPFPVISEVRVALVYRFKPVNEKYNKSKR